METKASLVKVIRKQNPVSVYYLPLVLGAKGFRITHVNKDTKGIKK